MEDTIKMILTPQFIVGTVIVSLVINLITPAFGRLLDRIKFAFFNQLQQLLKPAKPYLEFRKMKIQREEEEYQHKINTTAEILSKETIGLLETKIHILGELIIVLITMTMSFLSTILILVLANLSNSSLIKGGGAILAFAVFLIFHTQTMKQTKQFRETTSIYNLAVEIKRSKTLENSITDSKG